jgi:hypothetical protein
MCLLTRKAPLYNTTIEIRSTILRVSCSRGGRLRRAMRARMAGEALYIFEGNALMEAAPQSQHSSNSCRRIRTQSVTQVTDTVHR